MNSDLNSASQTFGAFCDNRLVGFIAVLHFPHPRVKNMKKIHRVVVLPDYQGIGIGRTLINFVAQYYSKRKFRVTITTSHPAINKSLQRDNWLLKRKGRVASVGKTSSLSNLKNTNTRNRITCSWEYKDRP